MGRSPIERVFLRLEQVIFEEYHMSLSKLSTYAAMAATMTLPAYADGLFDTDPAPSGFYVSGFVGGSFSSNADFTGTSNPVTGIPGPTGVAGVPLSVDIDFDGGTYFGGAIGYQLPFKYFGVLHPRLELEISSLNSDTDTGSFNNGAQTFLGGLDTTFYYLNNYSDLVFSEDQRFTPYIGGGLGFATVDSDVQYFPASAPGPVFAVQDKDTAFVTHTAIGGTFKVADNVDLYTEGRYFRIYNVGLERRFIGGGADLFNGNVEDDIDGFTITGGLRFNF